DTTATASVYAADPPGYLGYYGLRVAPFSASGDRTFLWLTKRHKAILTMLKAVIEESDGIFALTGSVGSGKTTLATLLIEELDRGRFVIAKVSARDPESPEFFRAACDASGMGSAPPEAAADRAAPLMHLLDKVHSTGQRLLVIVDDAQSLTDDLLRGIGELAT